MTGGQEPRRGRLARRLLALVLGTTIALVALEWIVDRFFPVRAQVYVLDERLLHDARPGARRIQPMEAARVRGGDAARVLVAIGPDGFRGPAVERPKRRPRVLVLGDSFVMAENVPYGNTFAVQLGRSLESELRDHHALEVSVEAINAGRSGFGPDQSLLQLEQRFDELRPDLVVHVLCAHNDLGDLMRNKLFRLGGDGELVQETPVIGERMLAEFRAIERRASERALVRLWKYARDIDGTRAPVASLPATTFDLYLVALDQQYREHWVERRPDVVSLFEDVYDADVALRPEGASARAKVALLESILSREVAFCAGRSVPLQFVVVPSAVDVAPGFGLRVDRKRHGDYRPSRLAESIAGAVLRAGGRVVDVTEALGEGPAADSSFVGGTDVHWNATGQARGAARVASELATRDDVVSQLRSAK